MSEKRQSLDVEIDGRTLPAPASVSFEPGSVVAGKYRVERQIGEGGLGTVVLATHLELGRAVAIKYLQPKALANPAIVDRFTREARLAAMLRSEHVVRVYDVATPAAGVPYLVMEFLEGKDLGERLEEGPLALDIAVDYVIQACDALADAHARGIVHRDLKPANLFIARGPGGKQTLKVLDFGISKLSERLGASGGFKQLTTPDDRFGTPSYMPPEQLASASKVDARSDVWALGVVLYELLTTEMPFVGETMTELCVAIGTHVPRPLGRTDLPPEIEQVILRCLAKEPENRFDNVAELAQELAPFASVKGRALVDQIASTTREGGNTVRPPMSTGEFMALTTARTSRPGTTPISVKAPTPMTLSTPVEALVPQPPARPKWLLVAIGAGALVLVGVLVVLLRARTEDGPVTSTPPPSPPSALVVDTAVVAPTAAPTPSAAPTTTESPAASATNAPVVTKRDRRGPPARPSGAPSATPPTPVATATAAPPTPAAGDRRAQFGERK